MGFMFLFAVVAEMVPDGCSERLASLKSEGLIYHDALLPHEVHRLCHEKEKEIERKDLQSMKQATCHVMSVGSHQVYHGDGCHLLH